jgi:hypothetical protein
MRICRFLAPVVVVLSANQLVSASAFVRGAYYRLGDDDPGAAVAAVGNNPTRDSFSDGLDLTRFFSPHYAADVPPRGPLPNKFSMAFANESLGGPGIPGYYGRATSLDMVQQGYALEAWVKGASGLVGPTSGGSQLIAYNGDPASNGFGLYRDGSDYVARIGTFQRKLGPAEDFVWHHLAYIQTLGTSSYYYDGNLVTQNNTDPLPTTASGGFWLAGRSTASGDADLFNGWIDEVRYSSFNPLAAGAFEPTSFLITVPEPSAVAVVVIASWMLVFRPRKLARTSS